MRWRICVRCRAAAVVPLLSPGMPRLAALHAANGAPALASALATSVVNIGYAGGSWLAGLALSTSLGLRGPALTGLILTLASLVPLTLLAAVRPSANRLGISRRLE